MKRTRLSGKVELLRRTVPAGSAPSALVAVDTDVQPQSMEIFVNGLRIDRALCHYAHRDRLLTLPEPIVPGDTLAIRAARP